MYVNYKDRITYRSIFETEILGNNFMKKKLKLHSLV